MIVLRNLAERLLNVAELVCVEAETAADGLGLPKWDQLKKDALKNQINDLSNSKHPVRKLLSKENYCFISVSKILHTAAFAGDRVKSFVMSVIGTTSASPIKIPPGLNIVQKELARLTGSFLRLVSHNRSVFKEYYEKILNDLLRSVKTGQLVAEEASDS